jgi:branched-chain amino acid transport system substrate-binding protein
MKVFSSKGKRAALVAIATAATVTLAACATAGSGSAAPADGSSDGPVRIGYIGALSGGSASMGVPLQQGMQLAIAELNESGELERELELISVDDEADASTSAAAAQRMVTEEGVVAVIGGPNSGTVLANNPIITGAGVVNLISAAQNDNLVDPEQPGFDLTFRTTENNSYDVQAIAQLFEDEGYASICAVSDTTEYGQSGIATIRTVFEERGLEIANAVEHEVNATDLTPQVLTLRDAGCDSVYLFDLGQDAALFMRTVNQVGWDVPVIGGRGLTQGAFLSIAGDAADGIIFPSVVDTDRPEMQAYIEAYDAEYGEDADPAHNFSVLGYDTIQLLAAALAESDYQGGEALADALESIEMPGTAGLEGSTLGFSDDDHQAPSSNFLTFWTIKDGQYQLHSRDVTSGTD